MAEKHGSDSAETPPQAVLRLDRYEVLGVVESSPEATSLRVADRNLDREVVLDRVHTDRADEEGQERFFALALALAQMAHPNIATIFDFGTLPGGDLYLTRKVFEGDTLAGAILRYHADPDPTRLEALVVLLEQTVAALGHAHERGIVHGALRPGCIWIDAAGKAVVTGWGLGRVPLAPSGDEGDEGDEALAKLPGHRYRSPEQRSGVLDETADLWAVGAIVREIVTPRFSTPGESAAPSGTVAALADVSDRCLAPRPQNRYRRAALLERDLERIRGGPARRGTWSRLGAVVADGWARRRGGVVALVLMVFFFGASWCATAWQGRRPDGGGEHGVRPSGGEEGGRGGAGRGPVAEVEAAAGWAGARGAAAEEEVRVRYEDLLRRHPGRAEVWVGRGTWYFQNRDDPAADRERFLRQAASDLRWAVQLDSADSGSRVAFALVLIELGRLAQRRSLLCESGARSRSRSRGRG